MEIKTFGYRQGSGWSTSPLPTLDAPHKLLLVFGAPHFFEEKQPLQALHEQYQDAVQLGCSTSGEIHGSDVADDSLSVALVGFEHTELYAIHTPIESMDASRHVGVSLGKAFVAHPSAHPLRGILVLSDGLHVNGSELVRGLNEALPEDVVVTGGLAGDGAQFNRTWVLKDGQPMSGAISAVGLYGEHVSIGHGSQGGWDKFGPERRVTRSENNVLYTLDDKPALALYKKYLGERATQLPASGLLFPLALLDDDDEKLLVRTILAVDEDAQSLTFAGDIPQGSRVRLMKANIDRLIQGAEDAASATETPAVDGETLAIAISCVGRRLVLGERIEDEIEATLDVLPPGTRQVGFYSYGEISPFRKGFADLHNQTMTLTTIQERHPATSTTKVPNT